MRRDRSFSYMVWALIVAVGISFLSPSIAVVFAVLIAGRWIADAVRSHATSITADASIEEEGVHVEQGQWKWN